MPGNKKTHDKLAPELEEMCEKIGISTIDYDGISEHFNELANLQSLEQSN